MIRQVASYLGVDISLILRCEEWVTVLFVMVEGFRPTFLSKKILKQPPRFNCGDVVVSKAGWCYQVMNTTDGRVRCFPLDFTVYSRPWGNEQFVIPADQLTLVTSPVQTSQVKHPRVVVAAPGKSPEKPRVQVEVVKAGVG